MPLPMVLMVAALDIRVIRQCAGQERRDRLVRAALHAAEQADIRFRKRGLRAAADAAADQGVHALRRKEARKRAVAAAIGIHNLGRKDFPVLCLIYFKLGGVAKVLEYLAVLICDCDFHLGYAYVFYFRHMPVTKYIIALFRHMSIIFFLNTALAIK